MGDSGAVFVGAYLSVIFSHGFRFGRVYLYVCQCLCLTGFVLVVSMVPWWGHEPAVMAGWLVSMIVLPFYVGALAERINAQRVSAEEALKECIERERGDVVRQ